MLGMAQECPGPMLFRNSLRAWQAQYKAQQAGDSSKDFRLSDLARPAGRQQESSSSDRGTRRRRMFR